MSIFHLIIGIPAWLYWYYVPVEAAPVLSLKLQEKACGHWCTAWRTSYTQWWRELCHLLLVQTDTQNRMDKVHSKWPSCVRSPLVYPRLRLWSDGSWCGETAMPARLPCRLLEAVATARWEASNDSNDRLLANLFGDEWWVSRRWNRFEWFWIPNRSTLEKFCFRIPAVSGLSFWFGASSDHANESSCYSYLKYSKASQSS